MTFCRDEENHWLPTQWPKQQTFVKIVESPLNAVNKATDICEEMGIATERGIRRGRRMPGEEADGAGFTIQQELRREMLDCLDSLPQEIYQVLANVVDL